MELNKSKGIYIPTAGKNQIKVDDVNKPFAIVKDNLFALYGREIFQNATNITARGKVAGTLGIDPNVLKAILGQCASSSQIFYLLFYSAGLLR